MLLLRETLITWMENILIAPKNNLFPSAIVLTFYSVLSPVGVASY